MTYKTLLVHARADEAGERRLQLTKALAARFEARVIGAGASAWAPFVDVGVGYAAEAYTVMLEDVKSDVADARAVFDKVFAGYGPGADWRSDIVYPDRWLIELARGADLIVATHRQGGEDARRFAEPIPVIMESGAPVLLCPPGLERLSLDTVLIAWKDTRESRRAISDALPLLKLAGRVRLVGVCRGAAKADVETQLRDVVERLARHGIKAEAEAPPPVKPSVTEDLLAIAASRGADLMVLGAYGHSRMREWAFGGVTADLLEGVQLPLLFSR